jgi:hypothetical protein
MVTAGTDSEQPSGTKASLYSICAQRQIDEGVHDRQY